MADPGTAVVHLVRHGETTSYDDDSGLTDKGVEESLARGRAIAAALAPGDTVRVVHAGTHRAQETAQLLAEGIREGAEAAAVRASVCDPVPDPDFDNFRVATPDGLGDVTAAFPLYARQPHGDGVTRASWVVEMDRFWQSRRDGGDPIRFWTSVPLLHFEPPATTVRRLWAGMLAGTAAHPGDRLVCATHSGPMRALLMWAAGYDPGEPANAEEVVVHVDAPRRAASLAYRGADYRVALPDLDALPDWWVRP